VLFLTMATQLKALWKEPLHKLSVVFDNGYTIKGPFKGTFTQTSVVSNNWDTSKGFFQLSLYKQASVAFANWDTIKVLLRNN
jgi:hypothetical protein